MKQMVKGARVNRTLASIDLNLLYPLQALLRERSVSRAAQHIGLSQPAMSAALKRLRDVIGDPLLVRVGRDYQLTARAHGLLEPLNEILTLVTEQVLDRPGFDPSTTTRTFQVAASSSTVLSALRPIIAHLASTDASVSFTIGPVTRDADVMLNAPDLDLVLLPDVLSTVHPRERLYSEEWVFVVDAHNPVVREPLTLEQLRSLPHGTFLTEGLHTNADLNITAMGRQQPALFSTDEFMTVFHMIAGTSMIATVQRTVAEHLARPNGLRILETALALPPYGIDMVWNTRAHGDPGHQWLRRELIRATEPIRQRTTRQTPDGAG